jgi:enoyl-CoA hydratase/carnithine racemase
MEQPLPLLQRREGRCSCSPTTTVAARNALSPAFYAALTEAALAQAEADPTVGAIVLTGEGGHFCAGGDLRQLAKRRELPVEERRAKLEGLHDLIRSVRDCRKPVIAAVEGAAAGAGLSLALACDMLVAARNAVFSVAYVKVGLTPDGGATAFLAEFVSRQVLTELCLTGERISGERLHALGPVNRLAEPGRRWMQALALARAGGHGPTQAMARIKTCAARLPQRAGSPTGAGSSAHGAVAGHRRIPRRHRCVSGKAPGRFASTPMRQNTPRIPHCTSLMHR